MYKILRKSLILFGLFTFSFSTVSAVEVTRDQYEMMRDMENGMTEFGEYSKAAEREFGRAQSAFNQKVDESNSKAVQDRKAFDEKFEKMKGAFENGSNNSNMDASSDKRDVDLRSFGKKNQKSADTDEGNSRPSSNKNAKAKEDDTSSKSIFNKDSEEESPSRGSLVMEDEDANDTYASSTPSSQKDGSKKSVGSIFKNGDSDAPAISQENLYKFAGVALFLFITMTVLFFTGSKKKEKDVK